ncbi:7-cyano-7-deazaguanine synthase QueC [Candidatus Ozemobacteraceae bacterium]|nr:7-cyano-7-deazaguanine synthase QueC [Candidatus Ozemobacteraceae bacterium]
MTGKPLAVVVASGGMDSCVSAAIARQGYDLAMFHLNYGQLTETRELQAFREQAIFYNAKHILEVDAGHFRQIGGSALTDKTLAVPDAKNLGKGVPVTYVPFRNANILAMAVSWAEVIGAVRVFIGAVEEDSSGYPDCRESFIDAFNTAIREGTRPGSGISIEAPLLHLNKGQIVRRGLELGAPLHLSWSCYQGEETACGTCESCVLRLRGFAAAGATDPIPYRNNGSI